MFTGIVQDVLRVKEMDRGEDFLTYTTEFTDKLLLDLGIGASVSHNGCCLTVKHIDGNTVGFDVIGETIQVTNLGQLKVGDELNIERAMRLNAEIGGHIMSGHISCTAEISKISFSRNNYQIWCRPMESRLMKYISHKGYVGLDGISLTVGEIADDSFCVNIIPETLRSTTIGRKNVGYQLNLEIDGQTKLVVDTVERLLKTGEDDVKKIRCH